MINNTSDWSCAIVSKEHNKKSATVNALITNNLIGAEFDSLNGTVSLESQVPELTDQEFLILDAEFDFDFEYKLTDTCKLMSRLLPKTLSSIPDAKLLIVGSLDEVRTGYAGYTQLVGLEDIPIEQKSDAICTLIFSSRTDTSHSSIMDCMKYIDTEMGLASLWNNPLEKVHDHEIILTEEGST